MSKSSNQTVETNSAVSGSSVIVLLTAAALLALAALGAVLYMQYTESEYYKAAPSAWPSGTGGASYIAAPPVAESPLALPPAMPSAPAAADITAPDASEPDAVPAANSTSPAAP